MPSASTLLADVGGTNTRISTVDAAGQTSAPLHFRNDEYASFDALLGEYLSGCERPAAAAFAVAGPVANNAVSMTNLGWNLSGTELARTHGLERVDIINDFAAQAWATTSLQARDLAAIGAAGEPQDANRGILGPGTGLGVSALVRSEKDGWTAVPGEGGHVSLAACTDQESELIRSVINKYGHCSAERLLSGPGLILIHEFLGGESLRSSEITRQALAGEAPARETINLFGALLGTVAANLALTIGARGGIYLTGGILPDIIDVFAATPFRERFESKGRLSDYLAGIPTFVITATDPGLTGLAAWCQTFRTESMGAE